MMPDSATAVRGGKLLEKCPLFATLDDEGRHELIARAWPRNVAAGQPICYVGEPGHNMMAIVVGTVRISLPTVRGREIILADLPAGELFGEIAMLAVDPACQHRGLGTALTEFGTAWLRDAGMRVAMIGTGGDPGHAPARRVYAKADYTLIPMARYFKAL